MKLSDLLLACLIVYALLFLIAAVAEQYKLMAVFAAGMIVFCIGFTIADKIEDKKRRK
jgi:4-hydroxybenzoate polyprenyltransferase